MAGKDPFRPSSRWRLMLVPALAVAIVVLIVSLGLVSPRKAHGAGDDVRVRVLSDFYRLQHAVAAYVADTGAFPPAVFDLTGGLDGGLSDKGGVPLAQAAAWKGPYLSPRLTHPTGASFWGLAEPCCLNDKDGDGAADEVWARLHRGYGEIDDSMATWLDKVLDDGVPTSGAVRVTPTWIEFQLLER